MANMKQYAVMRAKQDEEYQELHEAIKYMNEGAREAFGDDGAKANIDERSSGGIFGEDILGDQGRG